MVSPLFMSGGGGSGTERRDVSHTISSDSIYTERYMDTPQNNPGGYVNASISNVEGFKNMDFLLAHGSGDDNGECLRGQDLLV
jgi:dipeptidyl aminopeptidase/acylaminoacyl peptidase